MQVIKESGSKMIEVPKEVASQLEWLAGTPGQGWGGDVGMFVGWLIEEARKKEGWVRFQMDLWVERERKGVQDEAV